ncbi:retrotransposon protein, putative, ty1-copia subclass [Tanacetum coccineum]
MKKRSHPLLTLAFYDYEIWQMDVKTAFLNGYLDDIYMVQPEGFIDPKHPRKILKRYRMDNSKRGYILIQERLDLNKTQGASTPGEVKRMQNVPYASVVGSIINPEAELRVDCYCNARFDTDRDEIKSQT